MENTVSFEIIEHLGVIATQPTGWQKELNLVRWNGNVPKFDIREWDSSHERMSRGLTLKEQEMSTLFNLLKPRFGKTSAE